jgi:L-fucose isomerase-like protein
MRGDALAGAKKMVEMGFEHHVALTYGDLSEEMEALARAWGIELVKF